MSNRKRRSHAHAHEQAMIIHERLFLTFPQCVQALLTNHPAYRTMQIVNRNIAKRNELLVKQFGRKKAQKKLLSRFDLPTYTSLYDHAIKFARS